MHAQVVMGSVTSSREELLSTADEYVRVVYGGRKSSLHFLT